MTKLGIRQVNLIAQWEEKPESEYLLFSTHFREAHRYPVHRQLNLPISHQYQILPILLSCLLV